MNADMIIDARCELGEGPVWHSGALFWVDIRAGDLHRWNPSDGARETRHVGEPLGCAVPAADGRWLVAKGNTLGRFDWETGNLDPLLAPERSRSENRFNDGKCDPSGRWWIGSMNTDAEKAATGALYCCRDATTCLRVLSGLTISNGLCWSPDGSRFYHTDSWTRRIDTYDYNLESGGISNQHTLTQIPETDGCPDGMTIDTHGNLWVALWGGGAVVCLDGLNGEELARVPLPVTQVTSCTFGGNALDELFITTAAVSLTAQARAAQPMAGDVFRARPGVKGLPLTLGQI